MLVGGIVAKRLKLAAIHDDVARVGGLEGVGTVGVGGGVPHVGVGKRGGRGKRAVGSLLVIVASLAVLDVESAIGLLEGVGVVVGGQADLAVLIHHALGVEVAKLLAIGERHRLGGVEPAARASHHEVALASRGQGALQLGEHIAAGHLGRVVGRGRRRRRRRIEGAVAVVVGGGGNGIGGIEGHVNTIAPHILGEVGIVHKEVAVVLYAPHGVVARHLQAVHLVLLAPLAVERRGPCPHSGVARCVVFHGLQSGLHIGQVRVGHGHIHVSARKVALVAVAGLPCLVGAAALAHLVVAHLLRRGVGHHVHGVVGLLAIGLRGRRIEVVEVLVSLVLGSSPPTLRERMFNVHSARGFASLSKIEHVAAVSVDDLIGFRVAVGDVEAPPCSGIARSIREHPLSVVHQLVERRLQLRLLLALERRGILRQLLTRDGVGRTSREGHQGHK